MNNNLKRKYIFYLMTVINGIEIDDIDYKVNEIKYAIKNNDPIEDKLHVILVISNPCLFARRYILLKEFVKRIEEEEENVILYIVEMAYKKQKFIVTQEGNKRHLQVRCDVPLWHKENMINLGVKLLPANYKAFADYLGKQEIMETPDLVATTYAFESAMFFFDKNKLWSICDQGVNDAAILALTKRINGGTHGLDDRMAKTKKYYEYVK
jgi:hypothetical protein